MQYECENPLSGVIFGFFFPKISARSVTNTVNDFTKTLWLWKSGTKAIGPQVYWQTIAGHRRGMYLTPNTGEGHKPLHFRGKFLPVSWARKVLLCTFTIPLYLWNPVWQKNSVYTPEFSIKVLLSSSIEVCGTKKKLNFVDQVYMTTYLQGQPPPSPKWKILGAHPRGNKLIILTI
jgi:hypothetical protein